MQAKENTKIIKVNESYNFNDHLVTNFALLAASFLFYLYSAPSFNLFCLIYVVFGFYLSAFLFYKLHRHPLHNPTGKNNDLCDLHKNIHHRFFAENSVTVSENEQYQFVLMPTYVIIVLVFLIYPMALRLVEFVFWKSMAYWMLIGAQWMFIQYEVCHLASHSEDSFFSGFRHVNRMALDHRKHHKNHCINFGIATDFFDRYYKTKAK